MHDGFFKLRRCSFLPCSSIGRLCEDLSNIVGQVSWYDKFKVQNTKWLWLLNDIDWTTNNDMVLFGSFGLYPNYVAGTLNYKGNSFLYAVQ